MLHQRQSVYFIHKKHIQPNQSVFAAWFQQHSGGRTPSGWFFLLRLKTAAEQQLHENSVSVRSDCVKTEDPEDTNKKLLYFKSFHLCVDNKILASVSPGEQKLCLFFSQHDRRTSIATRVQYLVSGVALPALDLWTQERT